MKRYTLTMSGLTLEDAKRIAEQGSSFMWALEGEDHVAYPESHEHPATISPSRNHHDTKCGCGGEVLYDCDGCGHERLVCCSCNLELETYQSNNIHAQFAALAAKELGNQGKTSE